MKVLYLTNNPNRGSTTSPTEGWFRELRPIGLEPVVVSHEMGGFQKWLAEEQIPSYQVDLTAPSRRRIWAFASSLWSLRRIVRRHRIELIHCNEQPLFSMGRHLARLCGLPIAVSVHFPQGREFFSWSFRHACPNRLYFVSAGCREASRPGYDGLIPEDRVRVLNNGLNLSHYRVDRDAGLAFRREFGLGSRRLIGNACAIRSVKQLEHLIEAGTQLPDEVSVVLAGGPIPSEREYSEALLQQAQARLGDRFIHVGRLSDLRPMMNALDLFVNTSQGEACSISVLEALSAGCPVVGYPSRSVDTQILPGGGEIVPQDNVGTLAVALRSWLSDSAKLDAGRAGARRRVEEDFDIANVSRQLWVDYQDLLSKPQSRQSKSA